MIQFENTDIDIGHAACVCRNTVFLRLPAGVGRGTKRSEKQTGKQKAALYLDVGLTEGLALH